MIATAADQNATLRMTSVVFNPGWSLAAQAVAGPAKKGDSQIVACRTLLTAKSTHGPLPCPSAIMNPFRGLLMRYLSPDQSRLNTA
jgi:hypothetical protein